MVGIADKTAHHTDAVSLCCEVNVRGDILNCRAVALKSVIVAVETASRADDTANVIDFGIHDYLAVDGEVFYRTRSDLTEEAKTRSAAFHVETLDSVVLSVEDTSEVVAVLARRAYRSPLSACAVRFSFKVDVSREDCARRSIHGVDMVCKPIKLTCVADLVEANILGCKSERFVILVSDKRSRLISVTNVAESVVFVKVTFAYSIIANIALVVSVFVSMQLIHIRITDIALVVDIFVNVDTAAGGGVYIKILFAIYRRCNICFLYVFTDYFCCFFGFLYSNRTKLIG